MSLSTVLFLFLAHLGVGIVFTLVFVSREAGVKFFRFNAGLAAILIAIALAFRPASEGGTADADRAWARSCSQRSAIVVYWATVGRMLAAIQAGSSALSPSVAGLVALVAAGARVSSAIARCRCRC